MYPAKKPERIWSFYPIKPMGWNGINPVIPSLKKTFFDVSPEPRQPFCPAVAGHLMFEVP